VYLPFSVKDSYYHLKGNCLVQHDKDLVSSPLSVTLEVDPRSVNLEALLLKVVKAESSVLLQDIQTTVTSREATLHFTTETLQDSLAIQYKDGNQLRIRIDPLSGRFYGFVNNPNQEELKQGLKVFESRMNQGLDSVMSALMYFLYEVSRRAL
jgi:hypothetical protein